MKNTLADLNNHLFAEMERLSDEELIGEDLNTEIERAKAVSGIAQQIISNGVLALKAEQYRSDSMSADVKIPKFLEVKDEP